MKTKFELEKMLAIHIAFTVLLVIVRIIFSHSLAYIFYVWNLFLAIIPLVISKNLSTTNKISAKTYLYLGIWLLFFPNAPYIVTDIFHFTLRQPVPFWYDLVLVISAALNGLLLGIISLLQVEIFLAKHFSIKKTVLLIFICILLTAYGVYIGRFVRFNSWDIFTNTGNVIYTTLHYFLKPWQHIFAWGFIILFATLFCIFYYTLKSFISSFSKNIYAK